MFVEGIIIVLDLDKFEEYVEKHGLDPYKPNIVTGTLTQLIEQLTSKYNAVVIYGLDEKRGTEEAILEVPYFDYNKLNDLVKDLEKIRVEISKLGASISIVVIKDYVTGIKARDRRETYYGTPGRKRALKLLRRIKRQGGNKLLVEV